MDRFVTMMNFLIYVSSVVSFVSKKTLNKERQKMHRSSARWARFRSFRVNKPERQRLLEKARANRERWHKEVSHKTPGWYMMTQGRTTKSWGQLGQLMWAEHREMMSKSRNK